MLLAYAGPASNVRVEHESRECFRDGGALAEVMSLFENKSEYDLVDHQGHPKQNTKVTEQGGNRLTIEVWCIFFKKFFMQQTTLILSAWIALFNQ